MSVALGGALMTKEEADRLNDMFGRLEMNRGTPDMQLLDELTHLSMESKAEFVRRMDERYGVIPQQVH
jgi:hypothetical protein